MSTVLSERVLNYGKVTVDDNGKVINLDVGTIDKGDVIYYTRSSIELPGEMILLASVYHRNSDTSRLHAIGVWGCKSDGKWFKVSVGVSRKVADLVVEQLTERVSYDIDRHALTVPRSVYHRGVETLADLCNQGPGLWLWDSLSGTELYTVGGVAFNPYNDISLQWTLIKGAKLNVSHEVDGVMISYPATSEKLKLERFSSNSSRQLCDFILKHCLKTKG